MRYLITGINGFSGRHLAARLQRESGAVILGTGRRRQSVVMSGNYMPCDLTCRASVSAMVAWAQPEVVFHLAGLDGRNDAAQIERVNVPSFVNLSDALRESMTRGARLVVVGSAAELGSIEASALPVMEDTPCRPQTAYGRSKREITCRALAEPPSGLLQTIVARPFNLLGAGLGGRLALGSFARQLAGCIRGRARTIRCGSLQSRRDYLDIRDAVEAYVALAERGAPGQLYNVCSGQSYLIGDLLKRLITIGGVDVRVIHDAGEGTSGPLDIFGNHQKITQLTGWRPTISIESSLSSLLEHVLSSSGAPRRAAA